MNLKTGVKSYRRQRSITAKAKFSEEQKEAIWKEYAQKAEGYELKFIKGLKKMFRAQEKDSIQRLTGGEEQPFRKLEAKQQYSDLALPLLTDLMGKASEDAARLVETRKKADGLEGIYSHSAVQWLKTRIGWAAEQIGEETANLLAHSLSEGYKAGEGIPELSKRVSSVFDFCTKARAERIARTETIMASNQGAIIRYKEAGVKRLEFYAAVDERICVDCFALHENEFPVSESHGMIPIHPNCRCSWLPVVEL